MGNEEEIDETTEETKENIKKKLMIVSYENKEKIHW